MIRDQWLLVGAAGLIVAAGSMATAEDAAMSLTDRQITDQVMQKIAVDDPAVASAVRVTTRNRVVTLSGGQLTLGDILTLTHDAKDAYGVVSVENRLTVG